MDWGLRKSAPFEEAVRNAAMKYLALSEPAAA
jgi:hypothetical protein